MIYAITWNQKCWFNEFGISFLANNDIIIFTKLHPNVMCWTHYMSPNHFWPSIFRLLSVLFEVLEVMTKKANKWPRKPCNENHEFNCQTLVTLVVAYRDGIFFNWAITLIKINWITVLQSTDYQIINIFLIVCNISMSDDIKHLHSND